MPPNKNSQKRKIGEQKINCKFDENLYVKKIPKKIIIMIISIWCFLFENNVQRKYKNKGNIR